MGIFAGIKQSDGGHTPGITKLPPELIAGIVAYLKYDTASLSVCSLISRGDWHVESRRLFFHKLSINADEVKHHRLIPYAGTRHTMGTESFVREFGLHNRYGDNDSSTYASVRLTALAQTLIRFPSLEVVRINFTYWALRPGSYRFWEHALLQPSLSLPFVKRVTIVQSYGMPSRQNLYAFLRWFPALEELEVLRAIPPYRSLIPNDFPLPVPCIQLFVERSSSTTAVPIAVPKLNQLSLLVCTALAATALHTLAIDLWTNADIISARRILLDLGARLRHLVIRMPPHWDFFIADEKTLFSELDFFTCTNLHALTISVTLPKRWNPRFSLTYIWNHILHLLWLVISETRDTLSNITITVHSGRASHLPHVRDLFLDDIPQGYWDQFENTLALMDVDQLRRVGLRMGGLDSRSVSQISDKCRQSLRKFRKGGILHVSTFGSITP